MVASLLMYPVLEINIFCRTKYLLPGYKLAFAFDLIELCLVSQAEAVLKNNKTVSTSKKPSLTEEFLGRNVLQPTFPLGGN